MVKTKQCISYFTILILILSSIGVLQDNDNSEHKKYEYIDEKSITKSKQVLSVEDKKNNISCIEEKCSTPLIKLLSKNNQTNKNSICVYIYLKQSANLKFIETYVNEITKKDEKKNIVVGWVYQNNLKNLASLDSVCTIREVVPPEIKTGSVETRGDSIHNTDKVRDMYEQHGSGIKIGVISDSVDGMNESLKSGDLPEKLVILSNILYSHF